METEDAWVDAVSAFEAARATAAAMVEAKSESVVVEAGTPPAAPNLTLARLACPSASAPEVSPEASTAVPAVAERFRLAIERLEGLAAMSPRTEKLLDSVVCCVTPSPKSWLIEVPVAVFAVVSCTTESVLPEPELAAKVSAPLASSEKEPYIPTPLAGAFSAFSISAIVPPAGVVTVTLRSRAPVESASCSVIVCPAGKPDALAVVRPVL